MPEMNGVPPKWLKKKTMIKDQVGTVRATSYELPSNDHCYGKSVTKDPEGAGQVLSKWVSCVPSKPKESMRSFVATNRLALKSGCITSREQREYAKLHPNIKFKDPKSMREEKHSGPPSSGPFGISSKSRMDEPIANLVQAKHMQNGLDKDYPDFSGAAKRGRLPRPRNTKASRGHDTRLAGCSAAVRVAEEKIPFKMKKFQNVPARVGAKGLDDGEV